MLSSGDPSHVKRPNLRLIGVPESDGENRTKLENTLQAIIQENFPNLARQTNIQIQEIQRMRQRYSLRIATPRHIIVRFTKVEMKEKNVKGSQRESWVTHKGKFMDSQSLQKPYKPEESGGPYSTFLKKRILNQNFISSQTKLHKQRRNKILSRLANADGFCHHQACVTRTHEGSPKYGKEKLVPATAKTYQTIKTNNTMKKLHQLICKITS